MSVRVDAKSCSRDGLHEKMTMTIHHVETIASQMVLTDKSRAEADAPLTAKMVERPVVGKNIAAEDWGSFAEYNVVLVDEFCQV